MHTGLLWFVVAILSTYSNSYGHFTHPLYYYFTGNANFAGMGNNVRHRASIKLDTTQMLCTVVHISTLNIPFVTSVQWRWLFFRCHTVGSWLWALMLWLLSISFQYLVPPLHVSCCIQYHVIFHRRLKSFSNYSWLPMVPRNLITHVMVLRLSAVECRMLVLVGYVMTVSHVHAVI